MEFMKTLFKFNSSILLVASLIGCNALANETSSQIVLIKSVNTEVREIKKWTASSTQLKHSNWTEDKPLPLTIEAAVKIARKHGITEKLAYVELRRPLDENGNVFFYFVAFEKQEVVILFDGSVVEFAVERY